MRKVNRLEGTVGQLKKIVEELTQRLNRQLVLPLPGRHIFFLITFYVAKLYFIQMILLKWQQVTIRVLVS